ncbi:MAG: GNAT family protein [Chitinophagales bacterium]|nr:GNAT family N-acetyltransferase [Bacteroidota bacterium]
MSNQSDLFSNPPVLESEMVIMRPLTEADYIHLLPFAINEPELWTYSLLSAAGEDGLKKYLAVAMEAKAQEKEFPFIVYNKKLQQYAGSTRYYDIQLNMHNLQLGYTWYGKTHQGTGINTHCKYLLLQYAFEHLGIERVEFRADSNNAKSIHAMKKIGCVEEGILRSNSIKTDGGRRDSIVLSILKNEWYGKVKAGLEGRL